MNARRIERRGRNPERSEKKKNDVKSDKGRRRKKKEKATEGEERRGR